MGGYVSRTGPLTGSDLFISGSSVGPSGVNTHQDLITLNISRASPRVSTG